MTRRSIKIVHEANAFIVKKKTSKYDSVLRFSAKFQDFFKIQKIRNLKLILSPIFSSISIITKIIFARKIAFSVFFGPLK